MEAGIQKAHLVVGLGNPGKEYRESRHNIGFRIIDGWSRELGVHLTGRRFGSNSVRTLFEGKPIVLVCPLTYMNESGRSVQAFAAYYGISSREIVVVHDDLDLPLGRIRVVKEGGAGGHKGVLSIVEHLGTRAFPRVKVGIGRPRFGEPVEDFVLGPFYRDEREIVERVIPDALQACKTLVSRGIDRAMNETNRRDISVTATPNG